MTHTTVLLLAMLLLATTLVPVLGGARRFFLSSVVSSSSSSSNSNNDPLAVDKAEFIRQLNAAKTRDEVFAIAEDVPAIRRSVDKSMHIAYADPDDAHVAVTAVYRLGNLTASGRLSSSPLAAESSSSSSLPSPSSPSAASSSSSSSSSAAPSSTTLPSGALVDDRRFQQLLECVELRIADLKIAQLARYLWALTIVGTSEERANVVLTEYSRRLLDAEDATDAVTLEEAATMLWTMGCLKDSTGTANIQLVTLLSEYVRTCSDTGGKATFAALPPKLVVRVLWSLGIHGVSDDDLIIEGLTAIVDGGQLDRVPASSAVSLLWAVSQSRALVRLESTLSLLSHVTANVAGMGMSEMGTLADSLVALRDTAAASSSADAEQLLALVHTLEASSQVLVESFTERCKLAPPDTHVPVPILISVLRAAVSAKATSPKELWDIAKLQLQNALASVNQVGPSEAASLLEIVAFIPRQQSTARAPSFPGDGSSTLSPSWHRIAGRLAALCACKVAELKDRGHLINACWALASLGYPYRKILRAARKTVQYSLHELSANLLARLVVAVAAEEVFFTYSSPGKLRVAKVDREFVDDVAVSVFRTANEVQPLHAKVHALVAVAGLGRITSFDFEIRNGQRAVSLTPDEIKSLSTGLLIQFLWSTLRLPDGLVSADTMGGMESELCGRNLAPATAGATAAQNDGPSLEDLKLCIRTLSEAKANGEIKALKRRDELQRSLSAAILAHVRARAVSGSAETTVVNQLVVRQAQVIAADVINLCEIVQSFIDLNIHTAESETLFHEMMEIHSNKFVEMAISPCAELATVAYQLGRLEELLKLYAAGPHKGSGGSRYDVGKKILSRLLGMHR